MSREGRRMFWWSLLGAIAGVGLGYAMQAVDVRAWWDVAASNTDMLLAYLGAGILAVLGFTGAWHGGAIGAQGDSALTAAGWGIIPSVLIAAAGLAFAAAVFWFLQIPIPAGADRLLLPAALSAVLGWELGFFGVRPWGTKSDSSHA